MSSKSMAAATKRTTTKRKGTKSAELRVTTSREWSTMKTTRESHDVRHACAAPQWRRRRRRQQEHQQSGRHSRVLILGLERHRRQEDQQRLQDATAANGDKVQRAHRMATRSSKNRYRTSNQPSPANQLSRTFIAAPKGTPKSSTPRKICQAIASPLSQSD